MVRNLGSGCEGTNLVAIVQNGFKSIQDTLLSTMLLDGTGAPTFKTMTMTMTMAYFKL